MKTALEYFKYITTIPHVSDHEELLANYIKQFAIKHELQYSRDFMHNVVIKKPGTFGYESASTVMLQGHLDMVAAKREDILHDFLTDPLKLTEKDGIIRANGTTLGADNGVAVAYMLAILANNNLKHPPLECVFTVQEETGLHGAIQLDTSDLKSELMINLDAGPEGVFLVSCAGGCRMHLKRPIKREAYSGKAWQIDILGLKSGHSGADIHLERANALVLAGYLLNKLSPLSPKIVSIEGGIKDNVIPSFLKMIVILDEDPSYILEETISKIKYNYKDSDPDICIKFVTVNVNNVLCNDDTKAIMDALLLLPNGVDSVSSTMPGAIETSSNLAYIKTGDDLNIHISLRSSKDTRKDMLYDKVLCIANIIGATVQTDGMYPGWSFEPKSLLRDKAVSVYKSLYKKDPKIESLHVGLECGVFKEKMPNLDIISTGPTFGGMHTPDEWLDVKSFERFYDFLITLLEQLT